MNVRLVSGVALAAVLSAAFLSSCGSADTHSGGGGGVPTGHLIPTPDPLNLGGVGAAFAGTIVVTDNGYTGTISVSTTCTSGTTPVAAISPTSGSGPTLTIAVTPQNAGTCTLTYADSNGLSHTSTVNVTTGGVGVSGRSRS